VTTKRCPRCGETKALEEFHRDRTSPDGVQSRCKACVLAAQRLARAEKKKAGDLTTGELRLWRALALACARDRDTGRWLVSELVADPRGVERWFATLAPHEQFEAEKTASRLVYWAIGK
jgi:hypothetical protein